MPKSNVLGIRVESDASDKGFVNFFNLIQAEANRQGCVFFCDSGEGHELITEKFDGEDLSGWLVPINEAAEFEKKYNEWKVGKEADEFMRIAKWHGNKLAPKISFIDW